MKCWPQDVDSVIENAQASRDDLVLKEGARGDVDVLVMVGYDDHSSRECDIGSKAHVTRDSEMVELEDVGDVLETTHVIVHSLELLTKLDERDGGEGTERVHGEGAVVEGVHVTLHDKEIGGVLDGQEAAARDVDTDALLEELDGSTSGSLELDDRDLAAVLFGDLGVEDDVHVHKGILVDETLDGTEVGPQVVGVEDLELLDRLELIQLGTWDLGDLEELGLALVLDEGATLDIRACLVGDLHDKLVSSNVHLVEDVKVNSGTEVVDV
mmetsp:Transcript_34103/g.57323  ORF Transcript_34103/g.57323 Transcript_34103/m.57323 type:complete len:269 (+) Transcript_34103:106-912(+)